MQNIEWDEDIYTRMQVDRNMRLARWTRIFQQPFLYIKFLRRDGQNESVVCTLYSVPTRVRVVGYTCEYAKQARANYTHTTRSFSPSAGSSPPHRRTVTYHLYMRGVHAGTRCPKGHPNLDDTNSLTNFQDNSN